MALKSYFTLMAEYNQWMNESVYATASQLSHEQLSADTGAFFGSILGTLNHILVANIIWLKRFACHEERFEALESLESKPVPEKLDTILHNDLAALKTERIYLDDIIIQFTQELTEQSLSTALTYRNTKGVKYTKNFGHLLQHFFNHQTHHRGQVSTLLSQQGMDIGVTDLLMKIPDVTSPSMENSSR